MEGTVLVVDDDPLVQILEMAGQQAGSELRFEHLDGDPVPRLALGDVDLVLLDLHMPGKDGFAWLHGIRRSGQDLPVVIFTGRETDDAVERAQALGATAFLAKPWNPPGARMIVEQVHLMIKEAREEP